MDTQPKSLEASPLCKARIRNGISVWVWTAKERPFDRGSSGTGTGEFDWLVDFLAIHSKSQTDLVGKGTVTYADPDLCGTGSAEGTRPEQMCTDQNHLAASLLNF
jgi:hypothetical protein